MIPQLLSLYQIQKIVWFLWYSMLNKSLSASNPKDRDFNTSLAASNAKDCVFYSSLLSKIQLSPRKDLGSIIRHWRVQVLLFE